MRIVIRVFLGLTATAVVVIAATVAIPAFSSPRDPRGLGQEWLAWSPGERSAYIYGYLDGYLRGTSDTCNETNQLFEVDTPHRLDDLPSVRCFARLESYSKDIGTYATVLTDFSIKHREYQGVPVVYLLSFLTDKEHKNADQLYRLAITGKLRTHF